MNETHTDEGLLDARIEAALRKAMTVEPSQGFLDGARRRAREKGIPRPWPAFLGVAAALTAAVALGLIARWPARRPVTSVSQPVTPSRPVLVTPHPADRPRPAPPARPGAVRPRPARTAGRPPAWPEVIVPPGQAEAIERYRAALSRVPPGAAPAAEIERPPLDTADIEIPELAGWPAEAPPGGPLPRGNGS